MQEGETRNNLTRRGEWLKGRRKDSWDVPAEADPVVEGGFIYVYESCGGGPKTKKTRSHLNNDEIEGSVCIAEKIPQLDSENATTVAGFDQGLSGQ